MCAVTKELSGIFAMYFLSQLVLTLLLKSSKSICKPSSLPRAFLRFTKNLLMGFLWVDLINEPVSADSDLDIPESSKSLTKTYVPDLGSELAMTRIKKAP